VDKQSLAAMLDQGLSLEEIGRCLSKHPSTVSYWLHKYGLRAVNQDKHAGRGGIDPERLHELVGRGLSITEIAAAVERSKTTVRYWLERYNLLTTAAARRRVVPAAIAASGDQTTRLVLSCRVHGDTDFVREGSGYFRCVRCRSASVMRHRRRLKERLVADAGGRCALCGYDKQPRALEFHHLDPASKKFALSRKGITLSLETLRAEARKCVLLCSNCHAEVEDGSVALPDTVLKALA
jgi:transposase